MLSLSVESRARPTVAWRLLASPQLWHVWAPHIRGARGLGRPEVEAGRRGVVLLGLWTPVPARISAKVAGESWDWIVGPVRMRHAVTPSSSGCTISVDLASSAALESALVGAYGPVLSLVLRNLARIAARHS